MKSDISAYLARSPVIPVVTLQKVEHALPLADSLLAGGIDVLEITLRTPIALRSIEIIAKARPGIAVGAGTCRSGEDLRRCQDAGAAFAVSPGCTAGLLEAARNCAIPWLPGAATVSEMMALAENGFRYLKLFPAATLGGTDYVQTLSSLLPELRFYPTGGVNMQNAASYLALTNVICVGGSWLVSVDLLRNNDWTAIQLGAAAARSLHRSISGL